MIKGIVFDFNGTLFLDSPLHEQAWIDMAKKLRTEPLGVEEFYTHLQGRTNSQIISYLLGRQVTGNELELIAEEKEELYRKRCTGSNGLFDLAPGVGSFLDLVKKRNLPVTIATGSYRPNVEFYFSHLKLERWFDFEKVVYDDGSYPGKPAPDIFIHACKKINTHPADCLVFEDSYAGIRSALDAGIGRIVTVEPSLDKAKVGQMGSIFLMASGFNEMDNSVLK